jgi:hypothetical protein
MTFCIRCQASLNNTDYATGFCTQCGQTLPQRKVFNNQLALALHKAGLVSVVDAQHATHRSVTSKRGVK